MNLNRILLNSNQILNRRRQTTRQRTYMFLNFEGTKLLRRIRYATTHTSRSRLNINFNFNTIFRIFMTSTPNTIIILNSILCFAKRLRIRLKHNLRIHGRLTNSFTRIRIHTSQHPNNHSFLTKIAPFRRRQGPLNSLHQIFKVLRTNRRQTHLRNFMTFFRRLSIIVTPRGTRIQDKISRQAQILRSTLLGLPQPRLAKSLRDFISFGNFQSLRLTILIFQHMIRLNRYKIANANIIPTVKTFLNSTVRTLSRFRQPIQLRLIRPSARNHTRSTTTGRRRVSFLYLFHLDKHSPRQRDRPRRNHIRFLRRL